MKILPIATNTFREAVKDKVLYALLFFALLMIGGSLILGTLSVGEHIKILKDFGLASISIFGTLIAIFVGVGLVYKEIERKTVYSLLAKPISRSEFVLGKYVGLLFTVAVEVAVMAGLLLALVYVYQGTAATHLLIAVFLTTIEIMVMMAVALFFSSFSTPILSGMFTLAVYLIGHLSADLLTFGEKIHDAKTLAVTRLIYYLAPNLETFNVRASVVHGEAVGWEYVLYATAYGLVYVGALLCLTALIFSRRDFT